MLYGLYTSDEVNLAEKWSKLNNFENCILENLNVIIKEIIKTLTIPKEEYDELEEELKEELKRILEELTLKFKDSLKRLPTPSDINKIEELLNI